MTFLLLLSLLRLHPGDVDRCVRARNAVYDAQEDDQERKYCKKALRHLHQCGGDADCCYWWNEVHGTPNAECTL